MRTHARRPSLPETAITPERSAAEPEPPVRPRDPAEARSCRTPRRSTGGWRAARWVRRAVQLVIFALFVYLLFGGLQRIDPLPYASVFFRFDPLVALTTMISARAWLQPFALAIATLALAVVLGRYWCGWICPLGTLLGWARFPAARRRAKRIPPALRRVKYVALGVIVILAAFANLTLLVLDPISLLTRTATTSIIPGFVWGADTLARLGMTWSPTVGLVTWVEDTFRGSVLPLTQPRFDQTIALLILFLVVVALNALADRFWCRYLCPLGALLGLVAKVQVLRPVVGGACDRCGACSGACRVGAIELLPAAAAVGDTAEVGGGTAQVISSECTMCLDCLVACPKPGAMSFGTARPGPWAPYDPGRREALVTAGVGLGAAVALGTGVARAFERPGGLVRPPGAQDEARFLSRCLRCSECMKVCPTSGLQPSLAEAGLEGIWTPILKPRLGYCDFGCKACGQICPSGAIPPLGLEEKRTQVLGVAVIDHDRCLPWAGDTPCIVCQEMCPVPEKAIELTDERIVTCDDGSEVRIARPIIVSRRCIGCGICEYKCPVDGRSAIVVTQRRLRFRGGRA